MFKEEENKIIDWLIIVIVKNGIDIEDKNTFNLIKWLCDRKGGILLYKLSNELYLEMIDLIIHTDILIDNYKIKCLNWFIEVSNIETNEEEDEILIDLKEKLIERRVYKNENE